MKQTFTLILCAICFFTTKAQWNNNPTVNNIVCNTSNTSAKSGQVLFIDANDNTFIAWVDARNTAITNNDIYLQKLDADGNIVFAASGILVCDAINSQSSLNIISDGADGVIVSWLDNRSSTTSADIYMQRISGTGSLLWAANGISAVNNTDNQLGNLSLKISTTEFVIAWRETRNIPTVSTTGIDIFANKYLLSDGSKQLVNDIEIVKQVNTQQQQQIMSDNNNGFYCIWTDPRTATTSADIYAQRIANDGTIASGWILDGKEVANLGAGINLTNPQFTSDDAGGFITCWLDNRISNTDINVYSQKIDGTGAPIWTSNGVDVCTAAANQGTPLIIKDGAGGAIITWSDSRTTVSTGTDIYTQKLNSSGSPVWTANGVIICNATGNQPNAGASLNVISDKSGGAIICWDDARNGTTNLDVYAQRINSAGSTLKEFDISTNQWATSNGVPVATLTGSNQRAPIMVPRSTIDRAAIIVFLDARSGTANGSLYVSSLNLDGTLTLPINFDKVQAARINNQIKVNWESENNISILKFDVEKSTNGVDFVTLSSILATSESKYNVYDNQPKEGLNFYRIKGYGKTGEIKYSSIVAVKYSNKNILLTINPIPIVNSFKLSIQNIVKGNYTLNIIDQTGKKIFTKQLKITNTNYNDDVNISQLSAGNYFVSINNDIGKSIITTLIVKQQ
jgi:hypothetical protein